MKTDKIAILPQYVSIPLAIKSKDGEESPRDVAIREVKSGIADSLSDFCAVDNWFIGREWDDKKEKYVDYMQFVIYPERVRDEA